MSDSIEQELKEIKTQIAALRHEQQQRLQLLEDRLGKLFLDELDQVSEVLEAGRRADELSRT